MARPSLGAIPLILLVVTVAIIAVGVYATVNQSPDHNSTTATNAPSVVTSNTSGYFPHGYNSHEVNFSLTHSGDLIVVGNASFLYVSPTNLETRSMAVGPSASATTTIAVVTADYQCGTSMGQQRVFFVQMLNRDANSASKLDYCLILNTAISQGAYQGGVAHSWELWQVSTALGPAVALHMTGSGEDVSLVELCVEK